MAASSSCQQASRLKGREAERAGSLWPGVSPCTRGLPKSFPGAQKQRQKSQPWGTIKGKSLSFQPIM